MRHLCTCWHKLLKSIISLLNRISPLLLSSRVSLPSSFPVRLALLRVAVAVVVRARLGLIIVVDICWYLMLIVVDICALISSWIQSRLSGKPLKTHLGSCCTSEVSGLSHFETSGVPMSTITHAVLRPPPLAALPSSSCWPQLWVLRISCRALPQLCLVKSSLQVIAWSWNQLKNNFWKLALFLRPFWGKYPFAQFSILLVHIQGKLIQQKYLSVVNTANDRLYWISC